MMDTRGQGFGFIRVLAFAGMFIILFALGLAPFISVVLGGLDTSVYGAFGSWVVNNLNVWVFFGFIVLVFSALVWGFSSE